MASQSISPALTPDQAAHLAALDRIDAAAAEWKASLDHAVECGCAPDAIQNRTLRVISEVFGLDPAALSAMSGMLG